VDVDALNDIAQEVGIRAMPLTIRMQFAPAAPLVFESRLLSEESLSYAASRTYANSFRVFLSTVPARIRRSDQYKSKENKEKTVKTNRRPFQS